MIDRKWKMDGDIEVPYDVFIKDLDDYASSDGMIFVGTDSQVGATSCIFVTAICLHGRSGERGGRYYFTRLSEPIKHRTLKLRMLSEVGHTIEIANKIIELNSSANIEIHIDIGSTARSKTRAYVDMLSGWATGSGFSFKIKPDAWASNSVADKHTRIKRCKVAKTKK
jgi:uncharacterized protein